MVRSPERDIPRRWPTSRAALRVARYAPPDLVFTMTTIIGEDAVAMMIDSREYAQTQAGLFEVLWNASTPAEVE